MATPALAGAQPHPPATVASLDGSGGGARHGGQRLARRPRRPARAGHDRLAVLFLSVPTVKTHVSSILTKLDLNNRVQIALLVHDAGLLHDGE
jgi:hypothetical protein